MRAASLILSVAAVTAVLIFGGVQTVVFVPVEVVVALIALWMFWRTGWPPVSRWTMIVLGVLLALPLLQLIPLPAFVVSSLSPARAAMVRDLFPSGIPFTGNLKLTVNSHETLRAYPRLICYVLVFLIAFRLYSFRREKADLIRVLIGVGLFEAAWGLTQYFTGWQYIFTYAKKYYVDDATGTYINHNHFAGLLEMALPFALAGILFRVTAEGSGRARWARLLSSSAMPGLLKDLVLFSILCLGLIFSRSRMGIMAAAVGMLLVLTLAFLKTRRRSALSIALLVLALPAAYSAWIGLAPVAGRFESLADPTATGWGEGHTVLWRDTLALIRDYPWVGTGLGTYSYASLHYQSYLVHIMRYEHAHNDYLEFAADIGIPATVLLFGGLWVLVAKLARQVLLWGRTKERMLATGCAGAMCALLTHALADFNFQIPANALLFAWIAGTAAAVVTAAAPGRPAATR